MNTIFEVRLPNPYLDTECVKNKGYINYNIKSKYKSKFADYLNSKSEDNSTPREIKNNKTYKISHKKINECIYFTNSIKQYK